MAPFQSKKSDEQRRKDAIVMITAILFVGLLMGGVLGYKISKAENLDPAEMKAAEDARTNGEPLKKEPDPWSM